MKEKRQPRIDLENDGEIFSLPNFLEVEQEKIQAAEAKSSRDIVIAERKKEKEAQLTLLMLQLRELNRFAGGRIFLEINEKITTEKPGSFLRKSETLIRNELKALIGRRVYIRENSLASPSVATFLIVTSQGFYAIEFPADHFSRTLETQQKLDDLMALLNPDKNWEVSEQSIVTYEEEVRLAIRGNVTKNSRDILYSSHTHQPARILKEDEEFGLIQVCLSANLEVIEESQQHAAEQALAQETEIQRLAIQKDSISLIRNGLPTQPRESQSWFQQLRAKGKKKRG